MIFLKLTKEEAARLHKLLFWMTDTEAGYFKDKIEAAIQAETTEARSFLLRVRLSPTEEAALHEEAKQQGITMSELVRRKTLK